MPKQNSDELFLGLYIEANILRMHYPLPELTYEIQIGFDDGDISWDRDRERITLEVTKQQYERYMETKQIRFILTADEESGDTVVKLSFGDDE